MSEAVVHHWSVSEAKSKLSEVLRKARDSGPQIIGKRSQCVVISREDWENVNRSKEDLGKWLVTHSPQMEFEVLERGMSARELPFED